MSFTFRLQFTGLCAFVPNTSGKSMRVLLVDTTAKPGHNRFLEVHHAVLEFNTLDLAADNQRRPDLLFSDGNQKGLCFLKGQELSLSAGKPDPLEIAPGGTESCPDPGNLKSLGWVASLGKIAALQGDVDPACLDSSNVHPVVAARVRLAAGRIATTSFAKRRNRPPTIWKFKAPTATTFGPLQQALAEVVELQIEIADPTLTLSVTNFRGLTPAKPLRLRPASGNELTASIKCMPLDDI